jgi:Xaa-Pro aminopeptidase
MLYPKGAPDKAAFFGHRLENFQREVEPFWTPETQTNSSGSVDVMKKAIDYLRKTGLKARRIGVEIAFMPMDTGATLRSAFPDSEIVDALFVLERLRAVKSPEELAKLKVASELVVDAMLATIAKHGPGSTKQQIADTLKIEEVNRGLTFEYCLIAAGTSHNRAPAGQRWEKGDVLSVDSGGNYHGYIGDLARMAILGEPDAELEDLLGEIEATQRVAMKPIKAGVMGGDIYAAAESYLAKTKIHNHAHFLAHGMGLVSHEAPRLTASGPVPYDAYDATRPLEAGMVVSVETTLQHPKRGFIKLEDTAVVTDKGCDIYGEGARGWNRGGAAARS